ncbi:MAG: hypothetical protein ACOZQL_29465 [Myxococcota bacterium]
MFEYLVDAFVPSAPGCGKPDMGWDARKCAEFQSFLNARAAQGWRLRFQEYREVKVQGCLSMGSGAWLVCTFERAAS